MRNSSNNMVKTRRFRWHTMLTTHLGVSLEVQNAQSTLRFRTRRPRRLMWTFSVNKVPAAPMLAKVKHVFLFSWENWSLAHRGSASLEANVFQCHTYLPPIMLHLYATPLNLGQVWAGATGCVAVRWDSQKWWTHAKESPGMGVHWS